MELARNMQTARISRREPALISATLRITATGKTRPEIVGLLRSLVEPTRVETGCVSCALYADLQNPSVIVWVEEWRTLDDLERHLRSTQYRKILAALEMSSEVPDVRFNTVAETKGMRLIEQARGIDDDSKHSPNSHETRGDGS